MVGSAIDTLNIPVILGTIIFGAGVIVAYLYFSLRKTSTSRETKHETVAQRPEKKKEVTITGKSKAKKAPENKWIPKSEKQAYSHPWLLTSIKGHTGPILDIDFSSNGKYLASCADDRTVFIWESKDLSQRDRKSLRINIEFDYATKVKWSPDSKAFIISKYNENTVEVYKVDKKKDGWLQASKALTFPQIHETDIIGMGIASNGKYIMTCSNKTDLVVWDLKGQLLARVDTYLMNTTCAKISPCARFVAASGFTPEAKVWEVVFNKVGEFQDIVQVNQLTLGGHSSGVYDIAFDVDTSHIATVSKDGTWRFFDTKVNYKQGQDARLIRSGKYEQGGSNALIALSPNAEVIAIATFNSLQLFSTLSGTLDYTVENIYSGVITAVLFDASGKYILTAGDKQIRVFHNVTGYRCNIEMAEIRLKEHQTSATRERLQKLIADSKAFLDTIPK